MLRPEEDFTMISDFDNGVWWFWGQRPSKAQKAAFLRDRKIKPSLANNTLQSATKPRAVRAYAQSAPRPKR
jgi:hypothetical protein